MKKTLTILAVAMALPLSAEEPAKQSEEKRKPVTLSAAPATEAGGQTDSPLVAAARRSNRLNKKPAKVITNKDLKKGTDARFTTTENQGTLNLPAPSGPTPEMIHAQKREEERRKREAAEQRKRDDEAKRQAKTANAAERAEEGMYEDGDAEEESRGERDLQRANAQKPPQF